MSAPTHLPLSPIMALLTDSFDLCTLAMSSIESYLCLVRLAKPADNYSGAMGVQLKNPQSVRWFADMLHLVHSEMSQAVADLQATAIHSQAWIIPSYRSLFDASTDIGTLLDMVQEHLSEEDKSKVSAAGLLCQMEDALIKMKYYQHGCEEHGIASWKTCIRDVQFVLDRVTLPDD